MVRPVLAFVVAIALTVVAVRMGSERQAMLDGLGTSGRTASGFVTGAAERRQRGAMTYTIQYGYRVNGTTYHCSIGATKQQQAARANDPIAIACDPAKGGQGHRDVGGGGEEGPDVRQAGRVRGGGDPVGVRAVDAVGGGADGVSGFESELNRE